MRVFPVRGSGTGWRLSTGPSADMVTRRQPGNGSLTVPPSSVDQNAASLSGSRQSTVIPESRPVAAMMGG